MFGGSKKENKSFKINVKNGLYIGDLCYALDEAVYDDVWGEANYEDGAYTDPATGLEFAMVGTAYGDGEYDSSIYKTFSVDAGIIGIADLDICTKDTEYGVVYPNVVGTVTISYNDGDINIGFGNKVISVYTESIDDPEEDEYEDEWETEWPEVEDIDD